VLVVTSVCPRLLSQLNVTSLPLSSIPPQSNFVFSLKSAVTEVDEVLLLHEGRLVATGMFQS
jgi:hypothetical protein